MVGKEYAVNATTLKANRAVMYMVIGSKFEIMYVWRRRREKGRVRSKKYSDQYRIWS